MITCKECIESLSPWDPRVKTGRYHLSDCDLCPKGTYYRELEAQTPPEQVIIHRTSDMSKQDSDLLQQTAIKTNYLLRKFNEKKHPKRYNTYE